MPFARNSELPSAVKDALPSKAQSIFRNTANSVLAGGKSDASAFRQAWGAVKNAGYRKGVDGKWHLIKALHDPDEDEEERRRRKEEEEKEAALHGRRRRRRTHKISFIADIQKIDEDQHQVFGWFSVIEENGRPVVDREGDIIRPEELEKAAYGFVLEARAAGEMHKFHRVGRLIESMVFTKEKQQALGIDIGKIAWWGGFHIDDDEVWQGIKDGTYTAFSIGGTGERQPVD